MTNGKSTKDRKTTKAGDSKKALERRKERRKNRGNSEPADWDSVIPIKVLRLIGVVTALGGTITFGYTRDGGAYYLNYYVDGESEKIYIRPTEGIEQRLDDEYESWQ